MTDEPTTGLYAKLAWAQATMPELPRDRHVEVTMKSGGSYSYDYTTEHLLTQAMRRHLATLGVATLVSFPEALDLGSDGGENAVRVKVAILLVDSASGEREVVVGWGDGTDRGDKAIGKAQTSGERQLLGKLLLQAGGDDGESANAESRRGAARGSGGADERLATEGQIKRIYGLARESSFLMDGGRVSEVAVHDLVAWVTRKDPDGSVSSLAALTRDQIQRVFVVQEKTNGDAVKAGEVAAAIDAWRAETSDPLAPVGPSSDDYPDDVPF